MLGVQMEQRVNLKFLVKLGKTFTEAYAMLKEVYGNECLFCTLLFDWFKRFKEERETIEEVPRPGRPSMSKTDENIEKIVDKQISSGKWTCRQVIFIRFVQRQLSDIFAGLSVADTANHGAF
ncbi:hypothetical protein NQ318_017357 [Aromia moschata]|uniref:Mos1 transposase HTH domain-containing protein n=1 Tax=Aromia moschata TaxID=1265417 RepID=A0AAV8Z4V0_9CUCU|nr:hypothetical protein NQ318_017357 [Aromia moschata]